MYSIKIRINQRLVTLGQGDTGTIGVMMRSGQLQYYYWGGFSLNLQRRGKLSVESIPNEQRRNPRQPVSMIRDWMPLATDEFLLGSYDGVLVMAYLPFTIVKQSPLHGGDINFPAR